MRRQEVFGERERAALLALIELWEAGTGEPIDAATLARKLRRPPDTVWGLMNVCRSRRLVWSTFGRTITDGWIPLVVSAELVPDAEPYPIPNMAMGVPRKRANRSRSDRND